MVQIVASQMWRQQAHEEGGLATSLRSNQRWHTFVAVNSVHLHPMGHSRAKPGGQIAQQFRIHTWQPLKQSCHMVLAVPSWQMLQVVGDRVKRVHLV